MKDPDQVARDAKRDRQAKAEQELREQDEQEVALARQATSKLKEDIAAVLRLQSFEKGGYVTVTYSSPRRFGLGSKEVTRAGWWFTSHSRSRHGETDNDPVYLLSDGMILDVWPQTPDDLLERVEQARRGHENIVKERKRNKMDRNPFTLRKEQYGATKQLLKVADAMQAWAQSGQQPQR